MKNKIMNQILNKAVTTEAEQTWLREHMRSLVGKIDLHKLKHIARELKKLQDKENDDEH